MFLNYIFVYEVIDIILIHNINIPYVFIPLNFLFIQTYQIKIFLFLFSFPPLNLHLDKAPVKLYMLTTPWHGITITMSEYKRCFSCEDLLDPMLVSTCSQFPRAQALNQPSFLTAYGEVLKQKVKRNRPGSVRTYNPHPQRNPCTHAAWRGGDHNPI